MLNQTCRGIWPVPLCFNWFYLSLTYANAQGQYCHDILAVPLAARTAFMIVPLNHSASPFSSELCAIVGSSSASMFPSIATTVEDSYSPAMFDTSQSGLRPNMFPVFVRNASITFGVSAFDVIAAHIHNAILLQ